MSFFNKKKEKISKEENKRQEETMLFVKLNDYQNLIHQQQVLLNLNNIVIKNIKKYSIYQSTIIDLLKQKEQYDQVIWQYHFVIHILKQAMNDCEDLPFYINECKTIRNESNKIKWERIRKNHRRHRFYISQLDMDNIDASNKINRIKNLITKLDDRMIHLYNYYKAQIAVLDEYCKKCDKQPSIDSYLIQNKKVLRDVHENLSLSLNDIPVLYNLYQSCIINLLQDLFIYYKEANNLCTIIIEKGKQDLELNQFQQYSIEEFKINSLDKIDDLKKTIDNQKDILVLNNKAISSLDLSNQNELLSQKENNRKMIEQYYVLYHFLNYADTTLDELVSNFNELSKKEAIALKDKMLHYYNDYLEQVSLYNDLLIDFEKEQNSNQYIIQDSKLLRNIDNSLYLSTAQLPLLSDTLKECKIHLLYDLLGYYKKQNEICDKILNQKDV